MIIFKSLFTTLRITNGFLNGNFLIRQITNHKFRSTMGAVNCKNFSSSKTSNESSGPVNSGETIDKQPTEYIEGVVCREDEIADNEMKNFELGDGKILLVKQNGKFSAVGTKCSHYGAMLSTGALGDGRVRCPWHGACFNVETGDIEDFPGLASIPCYQVTVEAGQVKVRAKKSELESNKRSKLLAKRDANDERTFVVIGAGPSGATCVETLREIGFGGRLVMVGKEPHLPYDRIKLTKTMDVDIKKIQLRTQQFYDDNDIEVMLGVEAQELNPSDKEVTLNNGYKIKYDKVFVATGSSARKISIPGADLKNVTVIRELAHSAHVHSQLSSEKHVIVLGSSFIALEAAAYCAGKAAKVTVIMRDRVPLKPAFGEAVGNRILDLFVENKVEFIKESGIKQCLGTDGILNSVELNDGKILKADICIMGTGSTLNTDFLKKSGINLNQNGSITTDSYLRTNIDDVFVGGDIANSPVFSSGQELATIGHYGYAQYHGKIAALNMGGQQAVLKVVPYFWTTVFGKSFRYCGHGKAESLIIDGELKDLKFVVFFFDAKDNAISVASIGRDPIVSQFAEFLSQGLTLSKSEVVEDAYSWIAKMNKK